MCIEPSTALLISTAVSSGLQYENAKTQAKAQYEAQKRQNEIAKQNALRRYASEQLKIRQETKQTKEKGFKASKEARDKRAEFLVGAGEGGVAISGSTSALLADYYRTEGEYKNALARNLDINVGQFERNLEAIQFGQEAQSTYVQPPNPELLFASSALNVANTYYSLEAQKELKGLKPDGEKNS